jgi:GAF domain-containing protein
MSGTARDVLLARTFVELVDTLVDEFDVVGLLTMLTERSVEVLAVAAVGLLLVVPDGGLQVVASSSDAARIVELFELQTEEGPGLDVCCTGRRVVNEHLEATQGQWPHFAATAINEGFRSVSALPLRLRSEIIGAISLFRADENTMSDSDIIAAQALADVATIGIIHHRAFRSEQLVNEQLNYALKSHAVIEQAKGVLAERAGIKVEQVISRLLQMSGHVGSRSHL